MAILLPAWKSGKEQVNDSARHALTYQRVSTIS